MASELTQAIQQVCDEKHIPVESVVETIESALAAAYRKDFGNKLQNIKVDFDMETGGFRVYDIKTAVSDELKATYEKNREEKMAQSGEGEFEAEIEKVKSGPAVEGQAAEGEEIPKFNPKTMIALSEARLIKNDIQLEEPLVQELPVGGDFGRMAAQTAKQVIIQKLREAERNIVFQQYNDKIGELITGTVQRIEGKVVLIDFGNATAVMPLEEGIRNEKYYPGNRFKFYLKSVEQTMRGPKVIVSRIHPEILRKLFKIEVPEIASGTVQIKSIAREAGSRSKIAVTAKDDNIDPIGSCVGQRGTRVQTIINELGGEKIDIIEWHEDSKKFIARALSPAKVIRVEIKDQPEAADEGQPERETTRQATVYVAGDQLSLAIGKEGQNVRLAAKLTGWRIDIVEDKLLPEGAEEAAGDSTPSDSAAVSAADERGEAIKATRDEKITAVAYTDTHSEPAS